MQQQQESFTSKTSKQIEECIKGMQDKIESSFNRIDAFLDQTIDEIDKLFNQRFQQHQQQQSRDPQQNSQLPQLSSPNIHNLQFNNQLINQVTSLINYSVGNQLNKKEECLNQEFKKQINQMYEQEKIQKQSLEESIKAKDQQLQQKNSETQQLQQKLTDELKNQSIQNMKEKQKLEETIKAKDQQLQQKNSETQQLQQKLIDELKNQSVQNMKEKQKLEETIKNKDQQLQCQNLEIQQLKQIQTQQPIIQASPQLILKPFTYQLIQKNSIQQDNTCYAIAINKDCSIVIAGCDNTIKVFEFKQEVLKQTQLLSEHSDDVNTLNFMKKSNHFISGSDDKSIIIWSMNQSNQWICQQKLNEHNYYISCLVMNNNEDLIISSSCDSTIKFWMKQNQWLCQQTITDHTDYVIGLSLNQEQNKVISCGEDKQILIIEQSQQNSKWIVIQKINVERCGYRICFINDNIFTFQPFGIEQMHVYEMNNTNKQYVKTKDSLVKGGIDMFLFPQQHIKSKCLLVNKNGKYVNLIRTKDNGEFKTEQSIEFGSQNLFGCMSDDGQYLITWDQSSYEIQIRKYNEI